ncbi:MAG: glucosaminidase domain-containing protein [Candidatus Levybacteria bacterium]|nr:glucosaminidase domain-containing protein [Candidatus Levybacteria bacterium]
MKKLITFTTLFFAAIFFAQDAYADEVRSSSAKLAPVVNVQKDYALDTRTRAVRNIFKKYNSPLIDQAAIFVKYADEYGVDWKLLPSIAGLESTFGRFLMPGSYNAYGWGGGRIYFESWEDGIKVINKALRENYIDRGATDVWSIGPIYAESPTWSVRVNNFMNQFGQEYRKLTVFSMLPNI